MARNIKKGIERAQKMVDHWNENHEPGEKLCYVDDFGDIHETITRSRAWVLPCGEPVIQIEGHAGGYSLDRIQGHLPLH